MKRNLFFCDTPFQIMMALVLRLTVLKEQEVDVIISDLITNSESLYERIKGAGVFNETYYLNNYEFDYKHKTNGLFERINSKIHQKKTVETMIQFKGIYNTFYATDVLKSIDMIYDYLYSLNPSLEIIYFEEGPISVLCDQGGHFKPSKSYEGKETRLDKIFRIHHIHGNYCAAYVSVRNKLHSLYFEWRDIPFLEGGELDKYIKILNQFWNYKSNRFFLNKIVFLEESFFTDGKENRDIEIVNDLILRYGKDKVVVKLHPRTRINRFTELGLETYQDTTVPWELIALNGGLSRTVLICMGSGAILYPKLYWRIEQCSIALLQCEDYHFDYLNDIYYKTFYEVCSGNKLACLPKSKDEMYEAIDSYFIHEL